MTGAPTGIPAGSTTARERAGRTAPPRTTATTPGPPIRSAAGPRSAPGPATGTAHRPAATRPAPRFAGAAARPPTPRGSPGHTTPTPMRPGRPGHTAPGRPGRPGPGRPGRPGPARPGSPGRAPRCRRPRCPRRRGADSKGFIGALFDFGFTSFVTPRVIKVLYVLIMIGTIVGALAFTITMFKISATLGILTLVFGAPLYVLIVLAIYRVFLEFFMVMFRMADDIKALRESGDLR